MRTRYFLAALLLTAGCSTGRAGGEAPTEAATKPSVDVLTSDELVEKASDFGSYWNRGLAEMNRFELQQQRYGEVHEGEVVMIFVTEPFLKTKQVKHEFGPSDDAVKVMKMHSHRRFYTGLYPYNVHTSAFVPIGDDEGALKVAFSTTEWCGIVYAQLNKSEAGFRVRSHSYFQAEADEDFDLPETILEDEVWAQLRKDPAKMPIGEHPVVPGLTYLRFLHKDMKPEKAVLKRLPPVATEFAERPLAGYEIAYPELGRTLTIYHESTFPYRIYGFRDAHMSLFGRGASETTGRLTNSIMLDYWAKHDAADEAYRGVLGLEF